jgi:hypothetical protein
VDLASFVPDYSGVAVPDSHGVPFSAFSYLNTDQFKSLYTTISNWMSNGRRLGVLALSLFHDNPFNQGPLEFYMDGFLEIYFQHTVFSNLKYGIFYDKISNAPYITLGAILINFNHQELFNYRRKFA